MPCRLLSPGRERKHLAGLRVLTWAKPCKSVPPSSMPSISRWHVCILTILHVW
nr:MAG TPA: hypothetical protein [Caudoviricetes sp.]